MDSTLPAHNRQSPEFFLVIFTAANFTRPSDNPIMITLKTANHTASRYSDENGVQHGPTAYEFFKDHPYNVSMECFLGWSYKPDNNIKIEFRNNAFVDTVLEAYSGHLNLVIRPDDVWIAILTQFSFYVNGNSEELRKRFVSHEGKKDLVLKINPSPLEEIDWDKAGDGMIDVMHKYLIEDLKDWIMPSFSTTTRTDSTVSAIVMMASMKKYFNYTFEMDCGVPQVTLEGTKEDWVNILDRLAKLDSWDDTTRAWHKMLKPVVIKFVAAFEGVVDLNFWGHIVSHHYFGSGSSDIGGWITAFCAFSQEGVFRSGENGLYELDGVPYPIISSSGIPAGNAVADVIIDTQVRKYEAALVAGNMGMHIVSEDTVQNVPLWFCCLRKEGEE